MEFRIAYRSPWGKLDLVYPPVVFSRSVPLEEADALLCVFEPVEELKTFAGPKAFYRCEPYTSDQFFRTDLWKSFARVLPPEVFLNHWNPNPEYRVPHYTHVGKVEGRRDSPRLDKACAVVSNMGGSPWRRTRDQKIRTAFATNPRVDLYGRRTSWAAFRPTIWKKAAIPSNWKGEIKGDWGQTDKLNAVARYKVAVCIENTCEPYYFTEKFVDAVCAGCIPVYHAHETVRQGPLRGAAWVDPADFGFDPDATLEFALKQDIERYWDTNEAWLKSDAAVSTSFDKVYERIGRILMQQAARRATP